MTAVAAIIWLIVLAIVFIVCFIAYSKGWYPDTIQAAINRVVFYPQLYLMKLKYKCGLKQTPWDWIDDHVLMGGLPLEEHIEKLANLQISYAINLTYIYDPGWCFARYNIEQLRLPTIDHREPNLQDINRGVELIQKAVEEGKKIYVFCKGGHGRSAAGKK